MLKHSFISICVMAVLFSCSKNATSPLVDKDATAETVVLWAKLVHTLGDSIILVGHQDDLAYGHGWYGEAGRSDFKDITGEYPQLVGWELGNVEFELPQNLDSVIFADMKRYISETYARGGISTLSWHAWNIATGNDAWDCKQDTVVRSVLEGGIHHAEFLTRLDKVAAFFSDLKTENGQLIPVVFRMYHEHNGSWFWWGQSQCTPQEYKQLWEMTVNYLRNTKGVHNLLYAYSPNTVKDEAEYLERYPGNNLVDIVAFDCYSFAKTSVELSVFQEDMQRNLEIVTKIATDSAKLAAVGETGWESVPDSTFYSHTVASLLKPYKGKIAWVLLWRNAWKPTMPLHYYMPYKGNAGAEGFKNFVEEMGRKRQDN
jgi:mannan endo-1,4-beta-mannosidase